MFKDCDLIDLIIHPNHLHKPMATVDISLMVVSNVITKTTYSNLLSAHFHILQLLRHSY